MDFFELVTIVFEVAGVGAMVVGFVVAIVLSAQLWWRTRDGERAFRMLRETIGSVILLGLEILVAADLVKTVTSTPSLTDALVLAIIVIIRTLLSFSLQIEIEGTLPWRRLATTGPQQFARAVKRGGERTRRRAEEQADQSRATEPSAPVTPAVPDDEVGFPELRARD
ncbi:DUF1622 domain-containing protein [Plantibacter flavus]|uniref:DUF1622 domain-containing protein n=1 Tax=Plantibacter flavus TaxID=150123 RepID=UPI003F188774